MSIAIDIETTGLPGINVNKGTVKDTKNNREFIAIDVETNKDSDAGSSDETIIKGIEKRVNKGVEEVREYITIDVETRKDSDASSSDKTWHWNNCLQGC